MDRRSRRPTRVPLFVELPSRRWMGQPSGEELVRNMAERLRSYVATEETPRRTGEGFWGTSPRGFEESRLDTTEQDDARNGHFRPPEDRANRHRQVRGRTSWPPVKTDLRYEGSPVLRARAIDRSTTL